MTGSYLALFVAATLGQFPPAPGYGYGPPGGPGGPGSSQYGPGAVLTAPDSTHAFNTGDPFYPYDYEFNWTHGYYQEIPSYGGFHLFRPYNYKNVMPQSQVSAAWGNSANMPYSHQYFDRVAGNQTVWNNYPATRPGAPADLNAQLAEVDRSLRAPYRGNGAKMARARRTNNVTPATHRTNY